MPIDHHEVQLDLFLVTLPSPCGRARARNATDLLPESWDKRDVGDPIAEIEAELEALNKEVDFDTAQDNGEICDAGFWWRS